MKQNKLSEKLINRFKKITIEGYVVIAISFIVFIISITFIVHLIKALVNKTYMFDPKSANFDITMLIFFIAIFFLMLLILIYNLFIRKFDVVGPVTKDIEHGKIVERKNGRDEKLKDVLLNEEEKDDIPLAIDKEKLKKNLDVKEDDKDK